MIYDFLPRGFFLPANIADTHGFFLSQSVFLSHAELADFRRAHLLSLVLTSGTLTLGKADTRE